MTRLAINDLLPNTQYAVQIRAVGLNSVSEWSTRKTFTTISDSVLPKAPTNPTWDSVGDSFHAEWTAVTQNTNNDVVPISRYEIELVANGVTKIASVVPATGSTKVTYDLPFEANRALFGTPRPIITFRVRAVDNKELKSDWTTPTLTATNPAPGVPTSVTAAAIVDGVVLIWNPPAGTTDNDILGYNVYTSSDVFLGFTTTLGYTYVTATYSSQSFKVASVDKFAQDSAKVASNAVTPKNPFLSDTTAPATPTSLAATVSNDTAGIAARASVTWNQVLPTPNDLSGFYLAYKKSTDTNWSQTIVNADTAFVSGTSYLVLLDLPTAYTTYNFKVKAFDRSGNESAFTSTVNASPPANTAPANVTSLTGTPARDGIRYDWPANTEPDLKGYEITFSTSSTFASGNTTFQTGSNTLTVGGLNPATTYYARIKAADTAGAMSTAWTTSGGVATLAAGAGVSVADLSGGTFGAIDMVLGPGASLIAQGGAIRSNTYGSSTYNASATSGFYFDNGNLHIPDGNINVKALKSGTVSAATIELSGANGIIQTAGYNGTTGFKLSGSGLEVKTGAIEAAALKIQQGSNLQQTHLADFEYTPSWYTNQIGQGSVVGAHQNDGVYTPAGWGIVSTRAKSGSQSLRISWDGVTGTLYDVNLPQGTTNYNIPIEPDATYIVSAWFFAEPGGGDQTFRFVKNEDGGSATQLPTTYAGAIVDNGTWQRRWAVFTASSTSTMMNMRIRKTNAGTIYVDNVQVEKKLAALDTPSPWAPPGLTRIDGGMIRTGSIESTAPAYDATGATIPNVSAWKIDLTGNAVLGNAWVRGNLTVGSTSDDESIISVVQSYNYVAGETGWQLRSDGTGSLIGLGANTIRGEAIIARSLAVESLKGGGLSDEITLEAGSALVARGDMGEKVGLGDYGFSVNGPQENKIVSKASSGTTRTLVTEKPHKFVKAGVDVDGNLIAASKIRVYLDDTNYDTPKTVEVTEVVNDTTFQYVTETSYTQATTATTVGLVQGANPDLGDGPRYIRFPTDGTEPNIISGELTSTLITVTEGMSIRKTSNVEQGARLIINHKIENPKGSPTVVQTYGDVQLKSVPGSIVGIARGGNGNYFVLATNASRGYSVTEHNSAGTLVATRIETGLSTVWPQPVGLVYTSSFGGRFYLYIRHSGRPSGGHNVTVYNTSWVSQGSYSFGVSADFDKSVIGWDHTNNRLMLAWRAPSGSSNATVRYYNMNATTGVPTSAVAGDVTVQYASANPIGFIARGSFDYATDVIVMKDRNYTDTNTIGMQYGVATTTGTRDVNRNWPVAYNNVIGGAYWDTTLNKFVDVNTAKIIRQYEGADSYWSGTAMEDSRWVRYAWWKETGDLESGLSPVSQIAMKKRARLNVTISPIPYSSTNVNTPNKARIYILDNVTDTYPTLTNYKLRATIDYTSQVADIVPTTTFSSVVAQTVNDFGGLSGDPGQIISSTGNSFWRGDDTAQFFQLTVISDTDANTSSGNKPPLRIGDAAATHLRVDSNEIIAMTGPATQGTLFLNLGNQTNVTNLNVVGNIVGNTTFTGTDVKIPNAPTGSFAANANIAPADGTLRRDTSSRRFKKNEQKVELDVDQILSLEPKIFQRNDHIDPKTNKMVGYRKNNPWYYGFIAEDARDKGLLNWVVWDGDEVDGFAYDKWVVALQAVARKQRDEIKDLEERTAKLEALVKSLTNSSD